MVLEGGKEEWPLMQLMWADGGYQAKEFREWLAQECGWFLEIVSKPDGFGFTPLPRRWVVERTFAWLGRYRRLSRDYEYDPTSSEAMIYLASIRTMLHRITRKVDKPRTSRKVAL
jgi:putative transposase